MSFRGVKLQTHVFPVFIAVISFALAGASCEKSSASPEKGEDDNRAVIAALDKNTQAEEAKTPKLPIKGVDVGKLSPGQKKRFDKLVDSLVSPCGRAESLRKSTTVTKNCKRSLFAARYVVLLLSEGADDTEVRNHYADRYVDRKDVAFKLGGVPHAGPSDAPVVWVEFFDYGCPACQAAFPRLKRMLKEHGNDVVVYYKQYPIVRAHPNSKMAAQVALAAGKQGKYNEMHELLFKNQGRHSKDNLWKYAKSLGLDMSQFEKDFKTAAVTVEADMKEGELGGVNATPTLFIGGRKYDDPLTPLYLASWIEEELAVNR